MPLSCVQLFAALWTVAHQTALSMGFSMQENLNGLSFPSPVDLPNPRIEPVFLASPALGFFITEPPGKPTEMLKYLISGLFRKLYICLFSSVLVKKKIPFTLDNFLYKKYDF